MIINLDLNSHLDIMPWMLRNELYELYYNYTSHIFLFPSHKSVVMIVDEALANGLPCLDDKGLGETVDDTCSYRIKATTIEGIAAKTAHYLIILNESKNIYINSSLNIFKH